MNRHVPAFTVHRHHLVVAAVAELACIVLVDVIQLNSSLPESSPRAQDSDRESSY